MDRIWRAMQMDTEKRTVTGVPFLRDDDWNEKPEESEDGTIPMVPFEFTRSDFDLLKKLAEKSMEKYSTHSIEQMTVEKRVQDLLSEMLDDYMKDVGEGKTEGYSYYSLKPWFTDRATEILAMEVPG